MVVSVVERDPLLRAHEHEALAQFEKKFFQMGDECAFKLAFREGRIVGNSQEFEYIWVFDDVGGFQSAGFVVGGGEPALRAPSAV